MQMISLKLRGQARRANLSMFIPYSACHCQPFLIFFLTEILPRLRDKQMHELTSEEQKLFSAWWLKKPFKALFITLKSTYQAQAPILIFVAINTIVPSGCVDKNLANKGFFRRYLFGVKRFPSFHLHIRYIESEGVRLKFLYCLSDLVTGHLLFKI